MAFSGASTSVKFSSNLKIEKNNKAITLNADYKSSVSDKYDDQLAKTDINYNQYDYNDFSDAGKQIKTNMKFEEKSNWKFEDEVEENYTFHDSKAAIKFDKEKFPGFSIYSGIISTNSNPCDSVTYLTKLCGGDLPGTSFDHLIQGVNNNWDYKSLKGTNKTIDDSGVDSDGHGVSKASNSYMKNIFKGDTNFKSGQRLDGRNVVLFRLLNEYFEYDMAHIAKTGKYRNNVAGLDTSFINQDCGYEADAIRADANFKAEADLTCFQAIAWGEYSTVHGDGNYGVNYSQEVLEGLELNVLSFDIDGQVNLLSADAGAKGVAGFYKDENDGDKLKIDAGVCAEANADLINAAVAPSLGIWGTKVGATGAFKIGAGATADFGIQDSKLQWKVGAAMGLGLELGGSVDFSGTLENFESVSEYMAGRFGIDLKNTTPAEISEVVINIVKNKYGIDLRNVTAVDVARVITNKGA